MLPEPLQHGLREMNKPLALPKYGPFDPKAARWLVVTLKPIEMKNASFGALVEPEYSYDVQVIDLNRK
jgi:hypothetical protein